MSDNAKMGYLQGWNDGELWAIKIASEDEWHRIADYFPRIKDADHRTLFDLTSSGPPDLIVLKKITGLTDLDYLSPEYLKFQSNFPGGNTNLSPDYWIGFIYGAAKSER